ncbi:MAG: protein translocase subunit SecF [Francisellaceae bacterium]|jgi:preprotein translocase subunit SecF|nr:protein translocase subunit SecF [Francisellaceae bacterium]MBT6206990.1 protein translocase subunit SecF [Francisellaceae bacterium]MBT6539213.1 protein translocase subunit SecF [Francisellaceae bacterium]
MELFKEQSNINFMGMRKITGSISLLLCLISIAIIAIKGMAFGLEFTGGTQVELRFENPIELSVVREKLKQLGSDVRVQQYGTKKDVLIRTSDPIWSSEESVTKNLSVFEHSGYGEIDIRRIEYVGSEVGHQLAEQGGLAVLMAILSTMVYIALRFEYRFAISAAVALMHDSIIVLGIFSLFQFEFDLATLASVLAVLGYSLNDTIVVFDRVRENFRRVRKDDAEQIMNNSINQTLSRTIMTSFLTLLVVVALLVYGGESLFGFSLVLFLGIVIGTYSSIYVAGAFALQLGLSRQDLLPKPTSELDNLP